MMQRLKHQITDDLKKNRYLYLAVSFFIVTGLIAGCKALTCLEPEAHFSFLAYCGLWKTEETTFLLILLGTLWAQVKYFFPICFLSLWPVFLPAQILILIWQGVYFSALFSFLSYPFPFGQYILVLLLCLIIFIAETLLLIRLGQIAWNMAAYQFGLRNVPRTAKDRLLGASPFFLRCAKIFAISVIIAILKSITVAYLIQILI